MALLDLFASPWAPVVLIVGFLAYYVTPYLVTHRALRKLPAPFPAQFSNLWLLWVCRRGRRYEAVDRVHRALGPLVRIQPDHVSVNDVDAIPIIYGHGNGFLKAPYYDVFVSIGRGLFNTRDRAEHTRKRKLVSHTFSPSSLAHFEPFVRANLELFVRRWDDMVAATGSGAAHVDCLRWFNYLAFDIIGDLAFGAPFGMLASGADTAEVRDSPDSAPLYAPAIDILNRRGEVSATLGCLPELMPWAGCLPDPFFTKGLSAVRSLSGIAVASVKRRLEEPPGVSRKDLLARLMEGRDDKGEPLGREELTAEALTQLIAGSDTTSNSSCALLYHVVRTPHVVAKLQAELDEAVPAHVDVPTYDMVKRLPYLDAVLNETLRHHCTSAIGLPRLIPDHSPGVTIRGHHFPPGTVLSVPTYTVHHATEIWGPDADEFRPERWDSLTPRQRIAFIPFSHGPRACVGRNVAEMEMKLIAATWVRRYRVVLRQKVMETSEGFLRKPLALKIALKRRELDTVEVK